MGINSRNNNTISEELSTTNVASFTKKSQNNHDLNMSIISSEL